MEPRIDVTFGFWPSRLEKSTTVTHLEPWINFKLAFWRFLFEKTRIFRRLEAGIDVALGFWRSFLEKAMTVAHFAVRIESALAFWRSRVEKTRTFWHLESRTESAPDVSIMGCLMIFGTFPPENDRFWICFRFEGRKRSFFTGIIKNRRFYYYFCYTRFKTGLFLCPFLA